MQSINSSPNAGGRWQSGVPLFFFVVLCCVSALSAQNGSSPTGSDLFNFQTSEYDLDKAIETNEALLREHPNSEFAASVMFQLVELYYRKASEQYQAKMAAYEEELKKFENGESKNEPVIPRVSYRDAITMGYKVLEEFPTASFIDRIIYRLGICHLLEGNNEQALAYFQRLVDEYKTSTYVDEVNFRIGEQYFDQHRYEQAVEYYSRLLNSWESPFFDMALYKLAWSFYNLGNHTKAISTFVFLIDDLSQVEKSGANAEGVSSADLRREAIQYVAESFAEHGGAPAAEKFLLDIGEKEYSKTIFIRLGEIYQERNFYDESNETYRAILRLWPLHHTAPEVQAKIIKNLLLMERFEEAERAREELVSTYGPGSAWLSKHPEGEGREKALKLVEENLYILATDALKRGMESHSKRDLNLAIARLQEYLDKYPEAERGAQVQFYQGEAYYELGDYINAAKAYEHVVIGYPESELVSQAAYNRVLASFKQLDNLQVSSLDSITYYIEDFMGTGMTYPIKVPNPDFGSMLQACNDFAKYLPDDPKAPEVLMKYGEALFNLQQFKLAQEAYTAVVNRGTETRFTPQAYNMIAQCAFQQGDYVVADRWYQRLTAEYPDSTRYAQKAQTLMASAKFKLAEKLKEEGKFELAAEAFQNIAATTDNPEIRERAFLQAALQFEQSGNPVKAIALYENLRFGVPTSNKIDEALFKAATLSEELPDLTRAAQDYLELVRLYPTSVYAPKALFNAARAFENAQMKDQAAIIYERYANTYRHDPEKNLEALLKVAEHAYLQDDMKRASNLYKSVLKSYSSFLQSGQHVDEYLPAQAQFMIARIIFAAYRKVNIGKNFKADYARKQNLLNEVTLACKSTIQYKIADWTTGALYLIGAAWEDLARALYEAPRPPLEGAEMQAYETKLAQTLRPFKEKAIEHYRANLTLAEKTNVTNEWVTRSRLRAEQLTVELGLANSNGSSASNLTPESRASNNE